jgi:nucleotide-binding universal stress UspA family protein
VLLESTALVIAPAHRRPTMAAVTKILVPTDFSDTADAALEYAKVLANQLGTSLHLLYVFSDPYAPAAYAPEVYAPLPPSLRQQAIEEARRCLRQRLTAEEEEHFRGTCDIVCGLTAKQIVEYADENAIDLIVMGTHGRRGFAHLLLGSVAEHVVRTAVCPVLTVRSPGAEGHGQAESIERIDNVA